MELVKLAISRGISKLYTGSQREMQKPRCYSCGRNSFVGRRMTMSIADDFKAMLEAQKRKPGGDRYNKEGRVEGTYESIKPAQKSANREEPRFVEDKPKT